MLGLFGVVGRDARLRRLEARLHARDLHPRLVPDAVKIAAVRLLNEADAGRHGDLLTDRAGDLIAYAVLGPEVFLASNGQDLIDAADRRVSVAVLATDSVDAMLLLLLLYADLVHPQVVEAHGLVADPGPERHANGV